MKIPVLLLSAVLVPTAPPASFAATHTCVTTDPNDSMCPGNPSTHTCTPVGILIICRPNS